MFNWTPTDNLTANPIRTEPVYNANGVQWERLEPVADVPNTQPTGTIRFASIIVYRLPIAETYTVLCGNDEKEEREFTAYELLNNHAMWLEKCEKDYSIGFQVRNEPYTRSIEAFRTVAAGVFEDDVRAHPNYYVLLDCEMCVDVVVAGSGVLACDHIRFTFRTDSMRALQQKPGYGIVTVDEITEPGIPYK